MRTMKKSYFIFSVFAMIVLIAGIIFGIGEIAIRHEELRFTSIINITVDCVCLFIGLPIFFNVTFNMKKAKSKRIFQNILVLTLLNLILDIFAWTVDGRKSLRMLNLIDNTMFYILGDLLVYLFYWYMKEEVKVSKTINLILTIINSTIFSIIILLCILNVGYNFFFSVDSDGVYHRESLQFLNLVYVSIVYITVIITLFIAKPKFRQLISYIIYMALPFIITVIQSLPDAYGISLMYAAIFLADVIVFVNVQVEIDKKLRLKEYEVMNQKALNILSQVRPQFIYKTLNSIYYLADTNPNKAKEAIDDFAKYLRKNLDASEDKGFIQLYQEIDYIKIYVKLESLHMEGKFDVSYDIAEPSILIPKLSVQPIVESAIRHFISVKRSEGHLNIRQYSDDLFNYIIVFNDGITFDEQSTLDTERNHIGVESVRYRLEYYSKATLEVKTEENEHTTCLIKIPKTKNNIN